MDKTKLKAQTLLGMLKKRQVGTTTLMQLGTNNYDREFIVVANTKVHAQMVIEKADAQLVKMATLDNMHTFAHLNLPVAVDHHALVLLLEDVLDQIKDDEEKASQLIKIINTMMGICETYQNRAHTLEKLYADLIVTPWWRFKKNRELKNQILDALSAALEDVNIDLEFQRVGKLIKSYNGSGTKTV